MQVSSYCLHYVICNSMVLNEYMSYMAIKYMPSDLRGIPWSLDIQEGFI